jgi:predicted DNA-binding transcriptional regulator AlpA
MSAPSTTEKPTYVDVKHLAAIWDVSVPTARNTTKLPGFPAPLELGKRTKRWPLVEVEKWEQDKRQQAVRRVVTGTRPQHHRRDAATLPPPATVIRARRA